MLNTEAIPHELKERPNWVVRKGKIPFDPKNGQPAKAGVPGTWGSFEQAMRTYGTGAYDGIGFEFDGTGLLGIDIDHCLNLTTGELSEDAARLADMFKSFVEVSPSGTGLHIFLYGKLPGPRRRHSGRGIELYEDKRYFTVTGNVFGTPYPIEERQEALNALYAELFPPEPRPTAPLHSGPVNGYLEIGLEKDGKLRELWDGKRPNGNESADDMALMNKLAYWCNGDAEKMVAAFEQSPHCQQKDPKHVKKAERADYLRRTAAEALSKCTATAAEADAQFQRDRRPPAAEAFRKPEWEAPIPFDTVKVPPFPADCLPAPLRAYVLAVAENLQTAVDLPAVAALAVVALCVQGKAVICPKPGWLEPLSLYTVTVAPPSDRKSPVMAAMTRCIYEYVEEENTRRRTEVEAYQIKRAVLTKTINGMVESAGKTGKNKSVISTEDILSKQAELDELEEVKPLRLLADDATPEALTSLLAENNGRMAVVSAEGGLFDIVAGRYSQSVNIDLFLKAYSGEPVMIDRKGRKSEYIPHPALTLLLSIQPLVLHGLMDNGTFRGRGFLARFLYSIPNSTVGRRSYDSAPIPEQAGGLYRLLLVGLLKMPEVLQVIRPAPEAHRLAKEFFERLEPRLRTDLEEIEDWAGKYHGQVMRIAGLLHCCKWQDRAGAEPLEADTMRDAIAIGEYFLQHALAAFSLMGADRFADARYILRKMESKNIQGEITKRDMLRLCRKFGNTEELYPHLMTLVDYGYLREVPPPDTGTQTHGRKPEPRFLIHPMAYRIQREA